MNLPYAFVAKRDSTSLFTLGFLQLVPHHQRKWFSVLANFYVGGKRDETQNKSA